MIQVFMTDVKPVHYSSQSTYQKSPVRKSIPLQNQTVAKLQVKSKKESNQGDWGVQIGSFKDGNQAHMMAAHLLAKLPQEIEGQVSITQVSRKQGHRYRACLVGFSKEDAQKACYFIEKAGTPCLPFQKNYRQEKIYTAMNSR